MRKERNSWLGEKEGMGLSFGGVFLHLRRESIKERKRNITKGRLSAFLFGPGETNIDRGPENHSLRA